MGVMIGVMKTGGMFKKNAGNEYMNIIFSKK